MIQAGPLNGTVLFVQGDNSRVNSQTGLDLSFPAVAIQIFILFGCGSGRRRDPLSLLLEGCMEYVNIGRISVVVVLVLAAPEIHHWMYSHARHIAVIVDTGGVDLDLKARSIKCAAWCQI